MRPAQLAAVLTLATSLALCPPAAALQKHGEVPRVEPSAAAPRGEVLEWTTPQGQEYWYRLPEQAPSRRKPCLVLMLHGTGLDHGWSFWNYPIGNGRFRGDDIVVSPDGLTPGEGGTTNFLQGAKDGEQIRELIATFRERFELANVYLYGHSQGAFFCYWFAGEYPELVDGIVAHAGKVLDVKHSALSRQKVAVGILHTASDPVVPVECAHRSERIYREQGYAKLKVWIVEGIREEAGHWPLPDHVATMFEWLDQVSTADAAQAVEVARAALLREEPDYVVAVRVAGEARAGLRRYKGEDREQVEQSLARIEAALVAVAQAVWAPCAAALAAHDGGKQPGPYAADLRWVRRNFDGLPQFAELAKPFRSLFERHDKALAKLERIEDRDTKAYARALLTALEDQWFARGWDDVQQAAVRRVQGSWEPIEGLGERLTAAATHCGSGPTEALLEAARAALAEHRAGLAETP
jgi:predicted esterase